METCATCRFMAAPRDPTDDYRTCVRILHGNGMEHGHLDNHPDPEHPAIVIDGSGYSARLMVTPAFGCALHESPTGSKP